MGPVVAIIPVYRRADSVAATIAAVREIDGVDQIVVVDDGSHDGTADAAEAAGADRVVRLATNQGKGAAVTAGVRCAPLAATYLLVDGDVGSTGTAVGALLEFVRSGEADLAVGILPGAGRRGGFGLVKGLARRGIRVACGFEARAPLSGQRAVRGELLRSLRLGHRYGMEVAMTIDASRLGARIVEAEVAMEHRQTGRTVRGFAHRGRQGIDIIRVLMPRLAPRRAKRRMTRL